MSSDKRDTAMATPVAIPMSSAANSHPPPAGNNNNVCSSGSEDDNSPVGSSLGTSFFGKTQAVSVGRLPGKSPPSPGTLKKLLRVRKMSELARSSSSDGANITTIPVEVSDINIDWVKLVINQHRIKHFQPPLSPDTEIVKFDLDDCKKSSGDLSSTCRIEVVVKSGGEENERYIFIAKLLPPDDPCRMYVFEANVFEKEISIYFELLPCMRQSLVGQADLERLMSTHVPMCIYGSNNGDGAGVLVFECAKEKGFLHPVDPQGLSLEQIISTVKFMAKFHAVGSAMLIRKESAIKLRYPFLTSNVYSSPLMIQGAKKMFDVYSQFLSSVPGQTHLYQRFEAVHGEDAAKQMFCCMRRQVTSPFNTIIHGELWEKNILYRDGEDAFGKQELQCVVLDWKNAKIASATKDLAFLMLSSTNNLLRKESLTDVLCQYYSIFCETLVKLGLEESVHQMSFEDFYEDYKVSTLGAFLQSVCVLVQEMQYLEQQLNSGGAHVGESLRVFERRALNLMNDAVLMEII